MITQTFTTLPRVTGTLGELKVYKVSIYLELVRLVFYTPFILAFCRCRAVCYALHISLHDCIFFTYLNWFRENKLHSSILYSTITLLLHRALKQSGMWLCEIKQGKALLTSHMHVIRFTGLPSKTSKIDYFSLFVCSPSLELRQPQLVTFIIPENIPIKVFCWRHTFLINW